MRVAAVLPLLLLAACVTAPADGSKRVQSTSEANRASLKGAAEAPLRDLNLLRTKIPVVLLEAMADPYSRPPTHATCVELVSLVQPLDDALGADLDTPSVDQDDLLEKGHMLAQGKTAAYGAAAGAATDLIPFRGWVRKLTGAERHDKLVVAAISAGAVRRAYLKGLGEAQGCPPPATPSHVLAGREPITQEFRPRYPTRPAPRPGSAPGTPGGTPKAGPLKSPT